MLLLPLLAFGALPMVFLDTTSIEDAEGVRVEVRKPMASKVIIEAGAERPSLWMMPTATQEKGGEIWIWYQRVDKQEKEYSDQRTLCVATLGQDGLGVPAVDYSSPAWGGPNNVVLRRSPHTPTWGGFNVFQLVKNDAGYTLLYWDQPPEGEAGAMLAHSTDGLRWEKDPRGTVFTEHNDAYSLLETNNGYILYQTMLAPWPDKPYADNLDKFRRVQSIRFSKDLIEWTPQEVFLQPDAEDDPTSEFYLMKAFPYGQAFAGLLMKYYADPAKPKEHSGILSYELLVSDDAKTWRRPYRDTDLGFWSYAEPFEFESLLTFAAHDNRNFALFQYRRDGLTRAVAETQGTFLTPPFTMPEQGIVLNANAAHGVVELRLLNVDKSPVEGADAVRVAEKDGVAIPVSWDQNTVPGTPYRLHVSLENASIFSIRGSGT